MGPYKKKARPVQSDYAQVIVSSTTVSAIGTLFDCLLQGNLEREARAVDCSKKVLVCGHVLCTPSPASPWYRTSNWRAPQMAREQPAMQMPQCVAYTRNAWSDCYTANASATGEGRVLPATRAGCLNSAQTQLTRTAACRTRPFAAGQHLGKRTQSMNSRETESEPLHGNQSATIQQRDHVSLNRNGASKKRRASNEAGPLVPASSG